MTMPVMEPDLDAAVLENWARGIDEGPFSSLCWGERIAFENPDNLTLLGALAAWTDRVRLLTTVIVLIMALEYQSVLVKFIPGVTPGAGLGEFYSLPVFTCAGLMFMASAVNVSFLGSAA